MLFKYKKRKSDKKFRKNMGSIERAAMGYSTQKLRKLLGRAWLSWYLYVDGVVEVPGLVRQGRAAQRGGRGQAHLHGGAATLQVRRVGAAARDGAEASRRSP